MGSYFCSLNYRLNRNAKCSMSSEYLSSRQSARRSDSYFLYKVGWYESALVLKLSIQKESSTKHIGSAAAAKWSLQNPSVPQLLAL